MSGKSQADHVDIHNVNDPLPSPLTTRNLQPRLSQSLPRSAYRGVSHPSERRSSGPSSQRTTPRLSNTPAMQSNLGVSSSSSASNAGSSSGKNQTAESSGSAAFPKRRNVKRRRVTTSEGTSTSDRLISSDSEDIPIAGPQTTSDPSSSSSRRSGPSNVSVSSPSLRKILHPTNTESYQESSPSPEPVASTSSLAQVPSEPSPAPAPPAPEPLADYTCPICFFPPTNATLTPCGHICCGSCLFMAVKSAFQRGTIVNDADANVARCPVCRAPIPGWDGRGGGVIGLKARTLLSL